MKDSKDTTEMGENRTGIAVSPDEARKTAEGAQRDATKGTEAQLADFRLGLIRESGGVGTMPGANGNGSRKAPRNGNLPLLLDKMSERAAFERKGVRLYEALITKVQAARAKEGPTVGELAHIRDEELEHLHLVSRHMRLLGGDDTAESPCADVSGVASRGVMQVVADPRTSVAQSLSAILTAELTDNAGWELLIGICEHLGHETLVQDFTRALREENEHVLKVRRWITEDLARKLE